MVSTRVPHISWELFILRSYTKSRQSWNNDRTLLRLTPLEIYTNWEIDLDATNFVCSRSNSYCTLLVLKKILCAN